MTIEHKEAEMVVVRYKMEDYDDPDNHPTKKMREFTDKGFKLVGNISLEGETFTHVFAREKQ